MKYIVIVNQKHLVTVDANTHGGAEHKILDDIFFGIETCQAFTIEEMTTDTFKALAENCETISYAELKEKSKTYEETLTEIEKTKDKIENREKEVQEYLIKLDKAKADLQFLKHNLFMLNEEAKETI